MADLSAQSEHVPSVSPALRHPPLAPGWIDRPHHQIRLGDLELESGDVLRDTCLSWVEHGERTA